jgi:hypothetical protein
VNDGVPTTGDGVVDGNAFEVVLLKRGAVKSVPKHRQGTECARCGDSPRRGFWRQHGKGVVVIR